MSAGSRNYVLSMYIHKKAPNRWPFKTYKKSIMLISLIYVHKYLLLYPTETSRMHIQGACDMDDFFFVKVVSVWGLEFGDQIQSVDHLLSSLRIFYVCTEK
jgi:hypothetical protein